MSVHFSQSHCVVSQHTVDYANVAEAAGLKIGVVILFDGSVAGCVGTAVLLGCFIGCFFLGFLDVGLVLVFTIGVEEFRTTHTHIPIFFRFGAILSFEGFRVRKTGPFLVDIVVQIIFKVSLRSDAIEGVFAHLQNQINKQ